MHETAAAARLQRSVAVRPDRRTAIVHWLEHAAHLLPAQGPITNFVHHNTLHNFEHLPFAQAVQTAAQIYGCRTYLTEEQYRQKLAQERIRIGDLRAVLEEDLGNDADVSIHELSTRFQLRLAMLRYPLRLGPTEELRWVVAQTDALQKFRNEAPENIRDRMIEETRRWVMRDLRQDQSFVDDQSPFQKSLQKLFIQFDKSRIETWDESEWEAFTLHLLWSVCRNGVKNVEHFGEPARGLVRPRDVILEATGEDADRLVHEILIPFTAAYLDQGFANWPMPGRDKGFFQAFVQLYRLRFGSPLRWLSPLRAELNRIIELKLDPIDSISESLEHFGIAPEDAQEFITKTLLALRGWAGMIHQAQLRSDCMVHPISPDSLVGFLAIRLILDRLAATYLANEHANYDGPLAEITQTLQTKTFHPESFSVHQRAFLVFQLAQVLGWKTSTLQELSPSQWADLVREIESFSGKERRRIYHLAFEKLYRHQALDALQLAFRNRTESLTRPRFQAAFCLDDREESMRRHLEEVAPDVETFGVAGFFGVAMYYRGVAEAHFTPLAPVVVTPTHYVQEQVVYSLEEFHKFQSKTRRILGALSHQLHVKSRSFAGGAVLAAAFGSLATFPLVARVLFPRLAGQIRRFASWLVQPPPVTELTLEHADHSPAEQHKQGYTLSEMADISERILRDMGATQQFARLFFFIGHGSSSLNNPHKAAYDCGACGGAPGGPNARAIAQMLNDRRVRQILADRGIAIPADTVFVGGYHNTCDDSVTFFDLEKLPKTHRKDFSQAREDFERASDRNAHERCRRFASAPLDMTFEQARRHVEGRSEDLAQARPECGHATNALCVVGRRSSTRGLFMDRRVFLTSYDPTTDPDGSILGHVLAAVIPVCAGINLEYYFSYVDPQGWGCSTKLPHNVASLLGVMDGAASDLRPGLPWQMTEIHEPLRILFVIETTANLMTKIMDDNPVIGRLCRNEWVQLAVQDPKTGSLQLFHKGRFEPYQPESTDLPVVETSVDWYRGWRDHLGFAFIRQPAPSVAPAAVLASKEEAR